MIDAAVEIVVKLTTFIYEVVNDFLGHFLYQRFRKRFGSFTAWVLTIAITIMLIIPIAIGTLYIVIYAGVYVINWLLLHTF